MKKYFFLVITLMVIMVVLISCGNKTDLELVDDKSFYEDFVVDGNFIIYNCTVALKNDNSSSVTVKLLGDFQTEYDLGIVTKASEYGIYNDSYEITVEANTEAVYNVSFKLPLNTEYSGTVMKFDRELPPIKAEIQS